MRIFPHTIGKRNCALFVLLAERASCIFGNLGIQPISGHFAGPLENPTEVMYLRLRVAINTGASCAGETFCRKPISRWG